MFQEVTESAEDTVREFLEVSKEQCKDKANTENEKQKQDKTNENDIEASNDYDSDHYSEVDANEKVGNIDTLVDDADIDNKYDKVFTFAPGEGQHPLSLYQDKDAEYLCYITIFCGQTPPSRDERLVPVHYSDIVKWELRSVVYLDLQIPLTKCTRDIVFVNTSVPEERIFLLNQKPALDELPAESTDVESDNVIQRYSKRPKQLSKFCLADYVSKVDIIYPKGNNVPEKVNDKNDDDRCDSSSSNESEDSLGDDNSRGSDLLYKTKNGTKYKKRKVPRIIRYVKYNKKKDTENYFREQLMLFVPWRNE